jgi:uncharacterized integral membrane protein
MKSTKQALTSSDFAILKVAILIDLLLRVFILDNVCLSFHSLLDWGFYRPGDIGHVEDVLRRRLIKLIWVGSLNLLAGDKVALDILEVDDLAFHIFFILPHLLIGLYEAILVILEFLQLLLTISNLKSLSLLGLGTGNELRKSAFAGTYSLITISATEKRK